MSIICTVCGAENMEGSIYCEDCGARLPAGAAATATATAPPPPPAPAAPPPATPPPAPTPAPPPAPTPGATPAPAAGGTVECEACGAVNPAGEAYCEDCGAALPGSAAAEGPSVTIPDTPPVVDTAPTPPPMTSLEPAESAEPPATTGPSARAKLLLADGGQEFLLDKDTINIGRRSPVDGIFPEVDLTEADKDSYISRRHAKIEFREGGEILFEDLGSSNGSFLNGNRLQSGIQATIKDGDRLRLGKTELVFKNG